MRVLSCVMVLAACGGPTQRVDGDAPDGDAAVDAPPGMATCAAPALFDAGITPTRILHVAAGATGGDGSAASPFGSIEAAAAVATPGTAIRLGPGLHATEQ